MPIQPTRPEAEEDGTLDAYAHLYDVKAEERDRIAADEAERQARHTGDAMLDDAIAKEVEDRKAADEEIKGMIGSDISIISPLTAKRNPYANTEFDSLAIGNSARSSSFTSIAIGTSSRSDNQDSIAIGRGAYAADMYSSAIGNNSITTRKNEISVGNPKITDSYKTRLIANVTDPELPQDAATKNYVDTNTVNASSDSITVADGKAKLNPSIFSDGITATDAQVSADLGFIGEHLAGDGLYYDAVDGMQVKVGDGLEVQNDQLCIDQDKLPLASASNRGCVKVGEGLAISGDGTLSATGGGTSLPKGMAPGAECNGVVAGSGLQGCTAYLFGGWIDLSSSYGPTYLLVDVARGQITTAAAFTSGTSITFTVKGLSSIPTRFIQGSCMEVSFGGEYSASVEGYTLSVNNAEDTVTVTVALKADVPANETITFRIV